MHHTLRSRAHNVFGVQLYKNNACALLSRILTILSSDWLHHARTVRGVYEWHLITPPSLLILVIFWRNYTSRFLWAVMWVSYYTVPQYHCGYYKSQHCWGTMRVLLWHYCMCNSFAAFCHSSIIGPHSTLNSMWLVVAAATLCNMSPT